MKTAPERYSVDHLLPRADEIRVMEQRLDTIAVHWHDFYELAYVVSGTATHVVNGVAEEISSGSAFMLTPADFHEFHANSARPLVCYNVVIDAGIVEDNLADLPLAATSWLPATIHGCRDLEPDFVRLWRESQSGGVGTAAIREAVLRCIVIEMTRRATSRTSSQQPEPGADANLRRAILYVDRHFREQLTLAEVAAQAHLSPNYFSERFSTTVGTAFQSYLQNRRLRFARSLLVSTDLAVTEICHASGFNSLSHFGRSFRKRYGQAPASTRSS